MSTGKFRRLFGEPTELSLKLLHTVALKNKDLSDKGNLFLNA